MKLPKNYFENISAKRYKAYLKILPKIESDRSRIFIALIFTFFAISFFGIFAINPTLTTIFDLRRQHDDAVFVKTKLDEKTENLGSLSRQYLEIENDLPYVMSAIPNNPEVPTLTGQIQALIEKHGLEQSSIQVSEVELARSEPANDDASFTVFIVADGTYDNLVGFTNSLADFNRLVVIESISITKSQESDDLSMSLRARSFFKK